MNTPLRTPAAMADMIVRTELAFEIGSGLLTEVRKLQGLLTERDRVIQDMKDGHEKVIENYKEGLRTQKQVAGA